AAAPRDDDDLRPAVRLQVCDRGDGFRRSIYPLYRCRGQDERGERIAAGDDRLNIPPDCAGRAGGDADISRSSGQRALARLIEQPLHLQLHPQPLELRREYADTIRLDEIDVQLILPTALIDADPPVGDHGIPVPRREREIAHLLLE